jgi:hypothetical protein
MAEWGPGRSYSMRSSHVCMKSKSPSCSTSAQCAWDAPAHSQITPHPSHFTVALQKALWRRRRRRQLRPRPVLHGALKSRVAHLETGCAQRASGGSGSCPRVAVHSRAVGPMAECRPSGAANGSGTSGRDVRKRNVDRARNVPLAERFSVASCGRRPPDAHQPQPLQLKLGPFCRRLVWPDGCSPPSHCRNRPCASGTARLAHHGLGVGYCCRVATGAEERAPTPH